MKRQVIKLLIVPILLLILIGCTAPFRSFEPKLCLVEADTNRIVWSANVASGTQFILEYTHSVHRTPVKDYFEVSSALQVILIKTAFSTYGAGMPYELDNNFAIVDGFFVIDSQGQPMDSFLLRIVPLADHKLIMGNQTVILNELVSPNTLIRVEIE